MLDFSKRVDMDKVKVLMAIAPACCLMGPIPIILASGYLLQKKGDQ